MTGTTNGGSRVVISIYEIIPDEEADRRGDLVINMAEGYKLQDVPLALDKFLSSSKARRALDSFRLNKYRLECHAPEGSFNIIFRRGNELSWNFTTEGDIDTFTPEVFLVIQLIREMYSRFFA